MSVNRVSPLSSHVIRNDTQKPSSIEERVSAFSVPYLKQAWQALTGKKTPILTTHVCVSGNADYESFALEQKNTAIKVAQVPVSFKPHVRGLEQFRSLSVKRGDLTALKPQTPKVLRPESASVKSVVSEQKLPSDTPESHTPELHKPESHTPESQSVSKELKPSDEPIIETTQQQTPTLLPQSVSLSVAKELKPSDEELKNENKKIRKELARLCGLDESAFDRSYSKQIVEEFTKQQIGRFDLLDRFFETEKYNPMGPSKMASVRQLMSPSQIEKLLKEMQQELPKGQNFEKLNKEAASLIFYKNLDRMAFVLNIKINHEQFKEFKTADEALQNPPLDKLVTILNTYRISNAEKELITTLIDRFKQTFSHR